jgi:hypothetical protein
MKKDMKTKGKRLICPRLSGKREKCEDLRKRLSHHSTSLRATSGIIVGNSVYADGEYGYDFHVILSMFLTFTSFSISMFLFPLFFLSIIFIFTCS